MNTQNTSRSSHTFPRRDRDASLSGPIIVLLFSLLTLGILWGLCLIEVLPSILAKPFGLWFAIVGGLTGLFITAEQVPFSKCLLTAVIIALWAVAIAYSSATTGIPLGSLVYSSESGAVLGGRLPLLEPVKWIALIFIARGIAKAIMRPWHRLRYYGFWVLGLTCLLSLVFELSSTPITTNLLALTLWETLPKAISWHGVPWTNFFGRAITLLLLMIFVTPILTQRAPTPQRSRYYPIIAWVGLHLPFLLVLASTGMWSTFIVCCLLNLVVLWFAIRGASW